MGPPVYFFAPVPCGGCPGQAKAGGSRQERPRKTDREGKRETEREGPGKREREQRCPGRADGLPQSTFGSSTSAAFRRLPFRRDSSCPLPARCLPAACPPPAAHSHGPRGYWLQIGISGGMRGLERLITDTCRFWANVGHKIPGHWSKLFRGGIPNGACGLASRPQSACNGQAGGQAERARPGQILPRTQPSCE